MRGALRPGLLIPLFRRTAGENNGLGDLRHKFDVTPVVFAQRGANLHARIASAFFALRFVGFEVVSK